MIEFWQEVWEYLGKVPIRVAARQINSMWEIKHAIERPADYRDLDTYEYLCMVCNNIDFIDCAKLPDNLHARMVLGEQNRYTRDYISRWGA